MSSPVPEPGSRDWPYDGRGIRSQPWWPSRYGPDDEVGAAAEVTTQKVLQAVHLPSTGEVFDLGRVLEAGMPGDPDRTYHSTILAHNSLERRWTARGGSDMSSMEEHAEHSYHVGTHLDGLAHVGIGDRFYNGTQYQDIFGIRGVRKLGAHNIPPLVTRGFLIDVSHAAGGTHLPAGFVITPAHLKEGLQGNDQAIDPGDAVLIHTGWGRFWFENPGAYSQGEPGIGEEAAIWLARRRPCVVGSDNWAVEVVPSPDADRAFVVHQHLVAVSGIYILENLDLQHLAATGVKTFLFVLSPVVARGATGALTRPIAVL